MPKNTQTNFTYFRTSGLLTKSAFLGACLLCCQLKLQASETDQYSTLTLNLADVGYKVDQQVNRAISELTYSWNEAQNATQFAVKLSSFFNRRQAEFWSDRTLKKFTWRNIEGSIFRNVTTQDSRIIAMGGVAATLNLFRNHIGADKLTHFFGVGLLYYLKATNPENANLPFIQRIANAIEFGTFSEKMLWGRFSTGVFSNADLAANFDGMRFYLNLFETDFISGKPPLLEWKNGKPSVKRVFSFKDYVTPYWNEAFLGNLFDCKIQKTAIPLLKQYCNHPQYHNQAVKFVNKNIPTQYQLAGFEEDTYFNIHNICKKVEKNSLSNTCHPPKLKNERHWWKSFLASKEIISNENEDALDLIKEGFGQVFETEGEGVLDTNEHNEVAALKTSAKTEPNSVLKIPGCSAVTQKAQHEYQSLKNHFQQHSNTISDFTRKIIKNHAKRSTQLLLQKAHPTWKFVYEELNRQSTRIPRICAWSAVPQPNADQKPWNKGTRLTLRICYYQTRKEGAPVIKTTQYVYQAGKRFFVSFDGYFGFNDAAGYAFRSIPRLCSGLLVLKPNSADARKLAEAKFGIE